MNGGLNTWILGILITVIGGLLGLVQLLFGLLLKAHKDSDNERYQMANSEISSLRKRVHDISGQVGKIDQWQRFRDDGKDK